MLSRESKRESKGVRVNAVAPGAVKTKLIEGQIELGQYDEKSISAMHPMGRMGEPIEIANGVAWLLPMKRHS